MTTIPKKCVERHRKEIFQVKEQGSEVTFLNPHLHAIRQFVVDGCIFKDNSVRRCDALINIPEKELSIFIELKGSDIVAAFEQLSETHTNLSNVRERRVIWLICYSGSPRFPQMFKFFH